MVFGYYLALRSLAYRSECFMHILLLIVLFVAIAAAVSSCTKLQIQTGLSNYKEQDITICAKINHLNFLSKKQSY